MVLTDAAQLSGQAFSAISLFTKGQTKTATVNDVDNFTALTCLRASSLPTEKTSAPIYIVAVLDKSGSMSGEKITMLKETMEKLIKKLRPCDHLGIVSYDSTITVDLQPLLMDEHGKSRATSLIQALAAGSMTNLSGGLMEGLRLIPRDIADGTVVSTLLLTDGLANEGVTDTKNITQMMEHLWNKADGPKRSVVYTFGYGKDHNSDMLKQIAQSTEGMYYFIENNDKISESFADVLGGLFSVVAQNITLTVEAVNGALISDFLVEVNFTVVEPNRKYRIQYADIQSEEARDIPIKFTLPACEPGDFVFAKAEIDFFDIVSQTMESRAATFTINRLVNADLPVESFDTEVDLHANRVITCRTLKEAQDLAKQDKLEQARNLLKELLVKIKESPSHGLPLCSRLISDIEVTLAAFKDKQEYKTRGNYVCENNYMSHAVQRAAPQSYDYEAFSGYTYCNASRFQMNDDFQQD